MLAFLGGLVETATDREEILWSLGFVNDHFFDEEMAIHDYKRFLSKRKKALPLLAQYAQERLSRLEDSDQEFTTGEQRMARLQSLQEKLDRKRKQQKDQDKRKRRSKRKRKKRTY